MGVLPIERSKFCRGEWQSYVDEERYKRFRISVNIDIHRKYEFNAALKEDVSLASNSRSKPSSVSLTSTFDQSLRADSLSGFKALYITSKTLSGTSINIEALALITRQLHKKRLV